MRLSMGDASAGLNPSAMRRPHRRQPTMRREPSVATVTKGSPTGGAPVRRRMRSVGHVGRNSETTLRITTL